MPSSELVYVCEICQTLLEPHLCKAICPNCGRMLDCSDLPAMAANARFDPDDDSMTIRPGSDLRDWMPKGEESEPVPEPPAPEPEKSAAESVDDLP